MVVEQIFPAGQVVQVVSPSREYSPLEHADCAVLVQLYPAGHNVQAADPGALNELEAQFTQSVEDVAPVPE